MTMSVRVTKANATTRTVTRGNGPDRGANNLSVELNFIVSLNFKDGQISGGCDGKNQKVNGKVLSYFILSPFTI